APAPAEPTVAAESEEERRERAELLEEPCVMARERVLLQLGPGERRETVALGAGGRVGAQRWLRQLQEQRERAVAASRQREARAQAEWEAFLARKKAVAISSVSQRLGDREAVAEAVERIQARERGTERQLREARVENIKLKHEIQNLEIILKAQGELVEGQHGIDFEHMKKENQKHSENIGELNNEILKLKEKISKTVHILSQVKEKLHFLEAENERKKAELLHIEAVLSQKTHVLTKTKQARDRLREINLKLQQKCGLLGNEILLRDFERKVDTAELLNQQLKKLK
ncbi:CCD96 protein, partial [Bucco capensis]|nr:CCD96 protein [Bucco capensis]